MKKKLNLGLSVLAAACLLSGLFSCAPPASNISPVSNITTSTPAQNTTPVVSSRPEVPEGNPIITMQIRTLLGGTFEKLDIYSSGEVLDVKDTNLRMPPPEGPTRVWRTGQIQAEEFNSLIQLFQSSEFASLNNSYVFPGKPIVGGPAGGFTQSDAGYTFSINYTGLQKSVSAFGYMVAGDMPYPLGELLLKIRAVIDNDTQEVYREHIKYD